jgi:cell shape-determining protein MreC
MGTAKLVEKLEKFFDLSKKKQRKKHDKYLKVIRKLEKKKFKLEQKERANDASSRPNKALRRELQVISKLIEKAKQQDLAA